MLNVGPASNLEAGLVDFFRYPNSPVGREDAPQALALKDFVAQGVTIDYSAKFVLSGVNIENPAEFFSVVDTDGEPPESPNEIYLRPSISLAYKMLQDLQRKKYRPTITVNFPAPYNYSMGPDVILSQLMPMFGKVAEVLNNVYKAQSAAHDLAIAIDVIGEDVIDAIEREVEEVIIDNAEPSFTLRDRILSLYEGARSANRAYKKYEALFRGGCRKKDFFKPGSSVKVPKKFFRPLMPMG